MAAEGGAHRPQGAQAAGFLLRQASRFIPVTRAVVRDTQLAGFEQHPNVLLVNLRRVESVQTVGLRQGEPAGSPEMAPAFHGMVQEEITWLGGQAETFIGDAVLGVFGVPTSHDDDAVRAIRAALDIVGEAGDLAERLELPVPMQVRVGVNTGTVAVGGATDRKYVVA